MSLNRAFFFITQHVAAALARQGKPGAIVNIGSINGQAGQYGQVNYAAAKSGIHGFTKALAQEGAKFGVTVNAIAPGYIDTDMVAAVPPEKLNDHQLSIVALSEMLEGEMKTPPAKRGMRAAALQADTLYVTNQEHDGDRGAVLAISGWR